MRFEVGFVAKPINEVVLIKVWSSDFVYRNPEGFIVINWTILANTRNNFEVSRLSEFEYVVIGSLSIRCFRIMKDVKGKEFINEFSRALLLPKMHSAVNSDIQGSDSLLTVENGKIFIQLCDHRLAALNRIRFVIAANELVEYKLLGFLFIDAPEKKRANGIARRKAVKQIANLLRAPNIISLHRGQD